MKMKVLSLSHHCMIKTLLKKSYLIQKVSDNIIEGSCFQEKILKKGFRRLSKTLQKKRWKRILVSKKKIKQQKEV